MGWKPYPHAIKGIDIGSDQATASLGSTLLHWLHNFCRRRQAVAIVVPEEVTTYYVGRTDHQGCTMVREEPVTTPFFGVVVDSRRCTYFVVQHLGDATGVELGETMRDDYAHIAGNTEVTMI